MSQNYLNEVSLTIEAKRGRNVEKYRTYYESATELYNYINEYITSLNLELFVSNSQHYSELTELFGNYEFVSFIVITIVMGGNIIIIMNLVSTIVQPLKKLADSANEVAEGNFDAELLEIAYNDEIGIVSNAFNKMVISIKQYIERLRMSIEKERYMQERELMMETHLKDARLKYLQAQINPQFLFNTLNAGAQLAMMEGADRTYEYVQTDSTGDYVYVLAADGTVQRKDVVIGISTSTDAEITEGLEVGDKVITSDVSTLTEGMAVVETPVQ